MSQNAIVIKVLSFFRCIDVESLHFMTFSTKHHKGKIRKRDGHGKLRNGYGTVIKKYVKNIFKSVGTLPVDFLDLFF